MKHNLIAVAALMLLLLISAGCTTSTISETKFSHGETAPSGRELVANIKGSNTGLFLFYYLPIWSGSYTKPNRRDYDFWENQLRFKHMDMMLRRRAEKLGADDIENMRISENSSGFWSLWILWKRNIMASADAVRNPGEEK
ncbi:MAG: hypothetical protein PHI35_00870 [Victivallaceae bacterium]|nr:hypothetical protein [Victivallaceae bacterium]